MYVHGWSIRLRLHRCAYVYVVVYVYVERLLVLAAAGEVVHVPLGCLMWRLCGSPLCLPLHGGSFCRCPPRSAPAPRPTCPRSPGWSCRSCQSLSLRVKWQTAAERWGKKSRLAGLGLYWIHCHYQKGIVVLLIPLMRTLVPWGHSCWYQYLIYNKQQSVLWFP